MKARSLAPRLVAAIGISGALLLSGCTFMAPQATLNKYDPADGVGADLGDVLLRNVIAVTNEDGSVANVTFTAINTGEATKLNFSVPRGDGSKEQNSIPIPSGSTLVGERSPHIILVDDPDAIVGGLLAVTFQVGDADSQTLLAPVLDSQGRPYLDPLVP
ncbi:MAG: hypothetical protein BGO95_08450 [Micrococcales bacterium 73-13]|nr:MAG: hypothetical protein BGO95_08450 [Micrococcales bacterium 73-13]